MLVARCRLDQPRIIISAAVSKFSLNASVAPAPRLNAYPALIDTGAIRSCVGPDVIEQEQLTRHGHVQVRNIRSTETHSRYWISLGLFTGQDDAMRTGSTQRSLWMFEQPFEVINMAGNAAFAIIIGWDVLRHTDFRFDRASQLFELHVA